MCLHLVEEYWMWGFGKSLFPITCPMNGTLPLLYLPFEYKVQNPSRFNIQSSLNHRLSINFQITSQISWIIILPKYETHPSQKVPTTEEDLESIESLPTHSLSDFTPHFTFSRIYISFPLSLVLWESFLERKCLNGRIKASSHLPLE